MKNLNLTPLQTQNVNYYKDNLLSYPNYSQTRQETEHSYFKHQAMSKEHESNRQRRENLVRQKSRNLRNWRLETLNAKISVNERLANNQYIKQHRPEPTPYTQDPMFFRSLDPVE